MHIPDGFITSAPYATATYATTYAVSAGAIGFGLREARKKLTEKHVPMMGILAAFIFAAQMLNFPIFVGTSGHFLGAALAAILLGPWAAMIIMSCVLLTQCLIFQDGGLLTLGANIFNMGIVACFSSYYIYRLIIRLLGENRRGILLGGLTGAWVSVFLASIACGVELWVSGTAPAQVAIPAMAGWHALIGIGEGLITMGVLSLVLATRKDLIALERI